MTLVITIEQIEFFSPEHKGPKIRKIQNYKGCQLNSDKNLIELLNKLFHDKF